MMISHGTASADLTAFVHETVVEDMAGALVDDTVDLEDTDAVASCLIRHKFGGLAIGTLMDRAIGIARSRRSSSPVAA